METSKGKIVAIVVAIFVTAGAFVWMFSKQLGNNGAPQETVSLTKPSDHSALPQDVATTIVTGIPEVELVRTVKVQGTITGAYRDINDIQILSNGELAYEKSFFPDNLEDTYAFGVDDIKQSFFINDVEVLDKDSLTPVKEIGGKLTYLVDSGPLSQNTLVYGNEKKAPNSYFSKFEDIGGKLAYIYHKPDEQMHRLVYDDKEIATSDIYFTLLKDVGGKLAYVKHDKSKEHPGFKDTLFYDGQEVKTFGTPKDIEVIAGTVAYITRDDDLKKDILFYGDKQIDIADSIGRLASVDGKLVYQKHNDKSPAVLMEDGKSIATSAYDFMTREVGGKLAYTFISSNPDKKDEMSLKYNLVYDGVEITSSNFALSLTAKYGEMITDIEDVGGKLAYMTEGQESEDSFYYDGKKILTAEVIGNSYQAVDDNGGNLYQPKLQPTKPFYFYGADEKDGVTTFSIYRITSD